MTAFQTNLFLVGSQNLSESCSKRIQIFFRKYAYRYDVSPGLQANGYRSLLSLLESLLLGIIQSLRSIQSGRTKTFFRGNEHLDKLEIYSDILHQMRALLYYAQVLMSMFVILSSYHAFALIGVKLG